MLRSIKKSNVKKSFNQQLSISPSTENGSIMLTPSLFIYSVTVILSLKIKNNQKLYRQPYGLCEWITTLHLKAFLNKYFFEPKLQPAFGGKSSIEQ